MIIQKVLDLITAQEINVNSRKPIYILSAFKTKWFDDKDFYGGAGDTIKVVYERDEDFYKFIKDPLYKHYTVQQIIPNVDKPEYDIIECYTFTFDNNGRVISMKVYYDFDTFILENAE